MVTDRFNLFKEARDYYSNRGYIYIETPWIVSEEAIQLTIPAGSRPHKVKLMNGPQLGYLVASAEQGFLQMMLDGRLDLRAKYMSITPCFRDESEDALHQEYFMKLELFVPNGNKSDSDLITRYAEGFFRSQDTDPVWVCGGANAFDLEVNGIEVGSYYWRQVGDLKWACGTGLAQPRFDIARSKLQPEPYVDLSEYDDEGDWEMQGGDNAF